MIHDAIKSIVELLTGLEIGLMLAGYYSKQYNRGLPIEKKVDILKILFLPFIDLCWWCEYENHPKSIFIFHICAWIGDVILLKMGSNITFYLIGGAFFFLSHIAVIKCFNLKISYIPIKYFLLFIPIYIFPIIFLIPIFYHDFISNIGSFIYTLVILLAGSCSALRILQYHWQTLTFLFCYIGYILFSLSDSLLLSYNAQQKERPMLVIMSTYIGAIILITIGLSLQESTSKLSQPTQSDKDK